MIRKLKTIFTRTTKSDEIQTLLKHRISADDAFLDVLLRRGILLRGEIERIKSKSTLKKKNKKLLKYVFEKRRHEELIAALKEANQSDILDSLTTFQGSVTECEDDVTDDYKSHSQELVKHQLNRHSEEEDQSLSPEERQQNQEMEKLWGKSIQIHYNLIVERMSPEFGLIDRLFAHRAITSKEKNMIENKKIIQEKNKIILDCLSKNHTLEILVELLGKCDQRHLVRYLENDGIYSDGFDGDWPLTDEVISTIDCNYADIVDLLDVSDLINHLNATGVINHRQREFISSKSTSYEKNGALLDILRRSSLRSYWQTIRCLHQTNQSHIAEILTNGGVIMRVDVHMEVEGKRVNEAEKEIATKINNLLSDRSSDEVERIFDQLKLIRAKTCHSVSLYFLCNQLEEVERLEKLTKDGRLKEIVESLFNRLIKTPVKIKIDFNWKSDIFSKCLNTFQETDFPLTTINRLPFEALDLILQKSYLAFTLRQNQDQNLEDATFIKQLASVDFCWFKRIRNRRYKATVWSLLSRIYKVKAGASYLYKCNQEFIEASLIRLRVDKNVLKASCVLSDTEYAINTRRKTSALKKRPPTNGAEGLSVFASQRNVAAILDYLRYFHHSKERAIMKVLQNGGASFRVDARGQLQLSKDETDAESTEVKKLFPELYDNGMEILNIVQDRDTVIWIWCKSTNALSLEKLKQMNELKTTARLFFPLTKVDHQSTNIDCDQLKKDIVTKTTKRKYRMQFVNQKTAKEWLRLMQNGVPQDKALEWLKNEATSATAPIEYHDAWIVHNDQDIRVNNDITTAECLALRIYSNAVHKFYSRFNEDCSNGKWEHCIVFTRLLQSAVHKCRRRCSVETVKVVPDDECQNDVKINEDTCMPEEIETLTPPFRIFPVKRIYRINWKNAFQTWSYWSTLVPALIKGSLIGAVVGNCIGAPYEFASPSTVEKILQNFNKLEGDNTNRGQSLYTADICMTLALAESLSWVLSIDIEDLIRRFCQTVSTDPYQNYGSSTFEVLSELQNQTKDDDPFAPAKRIFDGQGSKGIGGAVRIAPLAVRYYYKEDNKLNEYVRTVTALTHSHPIGINGAILQAAAVQLALLFSANDKGHSDDFGQDYVDELIRRMKSIEPIDGIFSKKLRKIKTYLRTLPTDETIRNQLGTGITADESVPTAIYCFLRGMKPIPGIPTDRTEFERTIIYAISLGGKADSIASMAGAIAGAYYGQDAVTQRWRDLCETKAIDDAKLYANKMIAQIFGG